MTHAFISHSHEDKRAAELLVRELEKRGLKCWMAPRDVPPGGSYAESILNAIEQACCFVLLYSNRSNKSKHVIRAVERALSFGLNIVPIRLDASPPSKTLDYLLATVHWLTADEPLSESLRRAAEQIESVTATAYSQKRTIALASSSPVRRIGPTISPEVSTDAGKASLISITKVSGFGRGKEQAFEKSPITLGTDANCDVRFDPTWDKTVSLRHVTIEKRADGWWIVDQSRDGTWIDGQRVQQSKVNPGTVVELGKGGPRVRIDAASGGAKPAAVQTSKPEIFTRPSVDTRSFATPSKLAPPREIAVPRAERPPHQRDASQFLKPVLAVAALLVAAAVIGAFWLMRKPSESQDQTGFGKREGLAKQVGQVVTTETAAPGATVEWQPVADMGEEIFPSFIVASATMKESPFDSVNDSPTRLGDKRGVVGVQIVNPTADSKVRVELQENEVMRASVYEAKLPTAGQTYRIYPSPSYRFDALQKIKQTTPSSITVSVSLNGTSLGQKAKTIRIASINDCPFAVVLGGSADKPEAVRMDWMFAAYVNENHPISDELRKEALKTGIVPAFIGYQGSLDDVYKQVFAIWYVLQRRGVRYSNITTTPGSSKEVYSQYVRFIDQSINNSQANCVDGSVLFASILRQIGIDPILVLVPGHMFMGFYVDPNGQQADFLETTMIGQIPRSTDTPKESSGFGKTPTAIKGILEPSTDTGAGDKDSLQAFIAAIKTARQEYGQYFGGGESANKRSLYKSSTVRKEKANCQALPVAKAREMGVMPIGYQP